MKKGDFVTHITPYKTEHGRVKKVADYGVFVVYHCAGEWERYEEYTAALTPEKDLVHGWVDKAITRSSDDHNQ